MPMSPTSFKLLMIDSKSWRRRRRAKVLVTAAPSKIFQPLKNADNCRGLE